MFINVQCYSSCTSPVSGAINDKTETCGIAPLGKVNLAYYGTFTFSLYHCMQWENQHTFLKNTHEQHVTLLLILFIAVRQH